MRLLYEKFTLHNFKGVRDHPRLAGHAVNEKRVRRLVGSWATSRFTPNRA
ncbi:hypothetical protein GCM10027594_11460 [Hymenobacter agri]